MLCQRSIMDRKQKNLAELLFQCSNSALKRTASSCRLPCFVGHHFLTTRKDIEMEENQPVETTDSWSWGKIIKHVLLPKPKGSPKPGKKELSLRIGMAVVFGLIAINIFIGGKSLPSCDQKETTALVGRIVNDLPLVKIASAKFVSLKNISEQGHNKDSEIRSCTATLVTTAGEDDFQYSVQWRDKKQGTFEVEGRIVN